MAKTKNVYQSNNPTELFLFAQTLLQWHKQNPRPLPWKQTQDPYKIWLSEVILQQTRVEQGLPYYLRFVEQYPTVENLANAQTDELMRLWEGLGYYSRARNLHETAKQVVNQMNGKFPDSYKGLLTLKGIGNYTAAAIASFAFGLSHAVLDGNVYRVLARYFGIETPTDTTQGKKEFEQLANQAINPQYPAEYNQAIMDFGALQCTPSKPNCLFCPLSTTCYAFLNQKTSDLPIKTKKIVRKKRFFNYILIKNAQGEIYIVRREKRDIWQHLYEFPLIETDTPPSNPNTLNEHPIWKEWFGNDIANLPKIAQLEQIKHYKQLLTHQEIYAQFWECRLPEHTECPIPQALFVNPKEIENYAFPKIINQYWQDKKHQNTIF